jgi:hypothetical protein
MSSANTTSNQSEKPTLTLIQEIKDGSAHPSTLTKDQRVQCVEVLLKEGYNHTQISQALQCSEKTVQRDHAAIRERYASAPDPRLARQLIGDLRLKAEICFTRLMQLGRAAEASVAERVQAILGAWKVNVELTELLQSIGYIDRRPEQVRGAFLHQFTAQDATATLKVVEDAIVEIKTLADESGRLAPEVAEHLPLLQQMLAQAKLADQAQHLLTQQQQIVTKETPHDP